LDFCVASVPAHRGETVNDFLLSRRSVTVAVMLAAGAVAAAPVTTADGGAPQADASAGDGGGALSTPGDDASAAPDASQAGNDAGPAGTDSGSVPVADGAAGGDAAPCTATAYDAATEASVFNFQPVWSGAGPAADDGGVASVCGSVYTVLGVTDPGVAPYLYNGVAKPYPDAAGCHAYDAQGHQQMHDCLCDNCFALQQQCDALPGCKAIQKCGGDSGCTDPNSCYLIPGAPCTTIIDQWGNGSVSTGLAQGLETCGQAAKCPSR
jgi:hypothetical protein